MHRTDFGFALEVLKNGGKVARKGWNGKGMYVFKIGNEMSQGDGLSLIHI